MSADAATPSFRRPFAGLAGAIIGVLVLAGAAAPAGAQITTPLHVGARQAIADEFGRTLSGSASLTPTECDLVELLWASNSIAYAPALDGTPDPRNAPVLGGDSRIGSLTSPVLLKPGIFSLAIGGSNRPPSNSKFVVRAFNAPTRDAASFYGDSELLVTTNNDILVAHIGATTNAIDPRDTDGDGLNNSWEKSMGSDTNKWDTDGDGVGDGDEFRAGTGLLDPDSLFIMGGVTPWGDNGLRIEWDSVGGKTYYVQYSTNNLPDEDSFVDYDGVVTGAPNTTVSHKIVPNGRRLDRVHVRVRLAE